MEISERLRDVLDEQFPKGVSKERGAALVVFAEAMLIIRELKRVDVMKNEAKKFVEKFGGGMKNLSEK